MVALVAQINADVTVILEVIRLRGISAKWDSMILLCPREAHAILWCTHIVVFMHRPQRPYYLHLCIDAVHPSFVFRGPRNRPRIG